MEVPDRSLTVACMSIKAKKLLLQRLETVHIKEMLLQCEPSNREQLLVALQATNHYFCPRPSCHSMTPCLRIPEVSDQARTLETLTPQDLLATFGGCSPQPVAWKGYASFPLTRLVLEASRSRNRPFRRHFGASCCGRCGEPSQKRWRRC